MGGDGGIGRMAGRLIVGGLVLFGAFQLTSFAADTPPVKAAPAPVVVRTSATPAPVAPPAAMEPVAAPVDTPFVVKRILTLDAPLRHGDYAWDDDGVPQGPLVITVDIAAETISVFRDGYEIGAAAIVYGADDKPTPLGTFAISQKDAKHVSNLYDAPMPYMLRLTNDGVAIHASTVEWDAATRGCIGVPIAFAKLLFAQAKLGDRVIVTKGRMLALGETIAA